MTDLVERLRFIHRMVDTQGIWFDADVAEPIMREAADEIERLEHEVAQMTTARSVMEAEIERLREEAALWESRTKQGAAIITENVAVIKLLIEENKSLRLNVEMRGMPKTDYTR